MAYLPVRVSNNTGILKSVAQLVINSLNDGQTYDTLSTFTCYLPSGQGIRNARHLEIPNISFMNYIKQFHSLKNKFCFLYNGAPSSVEIDGSIFYTISNFPTFMNALFVAGGFSITCGYDPDRLCLTFTETAGNSVVILGQFGDAFPSLSNRCNAKLGYINPGPSFTSSTQRAPLPLRLNQEAIYIGTSLSNDSVSPSNKNINDVLLKIPLYLPPGSLITYTPSTDLIFDVVKSSIDQVYFTIYDEDLLQVSDLMGSPIFIEMHFSD
jgi:hypothetical protein